MVAAQTPGTAVMIIRNRPPAKPVRRLAVQAALVLPLSLPAARADYAERSVRIVVPFTAGGSTDLLARLYAEALSRELRQPVIVENKPGAGSALGSDLVARAASDGYTLLVTNTALIQNMLLPSKPPYDPLKDFAPIAQLSLSPLVYGVAASLGVSTFAEFVQAMRRPGAAYSYGSAGAGQTVHMYGELLKVRIGANLAHVPYKGEAPFLSDLAAGHVVSGFATVASMSPFLKSGRIRPLAVPGKARSPLCRDGPTLAELGRAGFEAVGWFGALAPAGTPRPIVERLNRVAQAMLREPAVLAKMTDLGLTPVTGSPDDYAKVMRDDLAAWSRVVADAGIRLE